MKLLNSHKAQFLQSLRPSGLDDCWPWPGYTDSWGYGKLGTGKHISSAHRLSYTLFKGTIPAGMVVRHSCHQPACVNPCHLVLGTHKDNKQDSVAADRHFKPKGALNGRWKGGCE